MGGEDHGDFTLKFDDNISMGVIKVLSLRYCKVQSLEWMMIGMKKTYTYRQIWPVSFRNISSDDRNSDAATFNFPKLY